MNSVPKPHAFNLRVPQELWERMEGAVGYGSMHAWVLTTLAWALDYREPHQESHPAQAPKIPTSSGGTSKSALPRPLSTDKRQGYDKSEADCPNPNHHKFTKESPCPTCGFWNSEKS